MSKNKKNNEKEVMTAADSGATQEGGSETRGGDISAVKFGSIFLALGICAVLMIIAKLIGL